MDTYQDLRSVRCSACGVVLLVAPDAPVARLHHLPDNAHRLIPAPEGGPVMPWASTGLAVRAGVLGVAVRLRDLAEDLDEVLAALGPAE